MCQIRRLPRMKSHCKTAAAQQSTPKELARMGTRSVPAPGHSGGLLAWWRTYKTQAASSQRTHSCRYASPRSQPVGPLAGLSAMSHPCSTFATKSLNRDAYLSAGTADTSALRPRRISCLNLCSIFFPRSYCCNRSTMPICTTTCTLFRAGTLGSGRHSGISLTTAEKDDQRRGGPPALRGAGPALCTCARHPSGTGEIARRQE
mmetsp:Transcript_6297/g.26156  ORF Transcript_6297/g.26156 Transcript_6297/m.26156 type:complete len:204 (+) Transcript_6297:2965-3576(+)